MTAMRNLDEDSITQAVLAPGHDEVLIEVAASGICGSDVHFMSGPKAMSSCNL